MSHRAQSHQGHMGSCCGLTLLCQGLSEGVLYLTPVQVAEILHSLFQELPSIQFKSIQQTMMKAITDLGTQHTQEVVEVIMSLCHPSER